MKTKEELNALKEQITTSKLYQLSDDALAQVTGGSMADSLKKLQEKMKIDSSADDSGGYQIDEKNREVT